MEGLNSKALCNLPQLYLLGYEQGQKVAQIDITVLPNWKLAKLLKTWDRIGRVPVYMLRF